MLVYNTARLTGWNELGLHRESMLEGEELLDHRIFV